MPKKLISILFAVTLLLALTAAGRTDEHRNTRRRTPTATATAISLPAPTETPAPELAFSASEPTATQWTPCHFGYVGEDGRTYCHPTPTAPAPTDTPPPAAYP